MHANTGKDHQCQFISQWSEKDQHISQEDICSLSLNDVSF